MHNPQFIREIRRAEASDVFPLLAGYLYRHQECPSDNEVLAVLDAMVKMKEVNFYLTNDFSLIFINQDGKHFAKSGEQVDAQASRSEVYNVYEYLRNYFGIDDCRLSTINLFFKYRTFFITKLAREPEEEEETRKLLGLYPEIQKDIESWYTNVASDLLGFLEVELRKLDLKSYNVEVPTIKVVVPKDPSLE